MCGISGFIAPSIGEDAQPQIQAMTNALHSRGPDDSGIWMNTDGVVFGHRRLSIVDLSPYGHQPMLSRSRRYVIVFNGEVYNFRSIREALKKHGCTFQGTSDTEVILAAVETWGLQSAIDRFVGMYAIALWDSQDKQLHLARDRMGEKPLYYGWNARKFVFASELKALTAHSGLGLNVDWGCLQLALRFGYVPSPWSAYHDIFKLPPGCTLSLSLAQCLEKPSGFSPFADEPRAQVSPVTYWSVIGAVARGSMHPFCGDEFEASEVLEQVLARSVRGQMVADVPVGAFLSGGIDSSTIVALMQKEASSQVKTFSIGFHDGRFNEAQYAHAVAKHLGTDHTELYVDPGQALAVIPELPKLFDEPFADSSQIPTMLVARLCSQYVTAALSGDGGDELFGGYDRYQWMNSVWGRLKRVPRAVRSCAARFLAFAPHQKIQTLARILQYPDEFRLYEGIMSHWEAPEVLFGTAPRRRVAYPPRSLPTRCSSLLSHMTTVDMMTYLPDDILVKVDRASMAASLETRAPFLDHRVVEFACSLPDAHKCDTTSSKKILRSVLARHVPLELVDRPKMGFRIPVGEWLRTELRDWAEDLLAPHSLEEHGLNPAPVQRKWKEHLAGSDRWEHHLWGALMVQAWLRQTPTGASL